jgi:hypothetical protein
MRPMDGSDRPDQRPSRRGGVIHRMGDDSVNVAFCPQARCGLLRLKVRTLAAGPNGRSNGISKACRTYPADSCGIYKYLESNYLF